MNRADLPFESHRTFQLWSATVSHSQLLLRSPRGEREGTRVDLLFKPVSALKLRTILTGLRVRDPSESEGLELARELGDLGADERVFIVESEGIVGYVVALGFWVAEDERGYDEPSSLAGGGPEG